MNEKKILIVEDEAINALFLKMILENLNFNVLDIARTGEDAVKMALEYNPDIIFMDIMLEGKMNGIEAIKEIEKNNRSIPHVYCTAYSDDEFLTKALNTNPLKILLKPVQEEDLKEFFDNYMKTPS